MSNNRAPPRVTSIPAHILRSSARRAKKRAEKIKQEFPVFKLTPLVNTNMITLINETLAKGNIHRILTSNLVTAADVLKYIQTERPNEMLMEVYRAACIYGGDVAHIIDGQHFLQNSNNEKYKYIYTKYCPQANPIYKPLSFAPNVNNKDNLRMDEIKKGLPIHMLDEGIETLKQCGEWDTIYAYRLRPLCEVSSTHIEVAIRNEYYEVLINYDLKDQSKVVTKLIIELCFGLRSTTTIYWPEVAQPTISIFIKFLQQKYGPDYFNLDCQLELYSYFPLLFNFGQLSALQKSIISMEYRQLQGYYLGYPIQDYVPTISQIYAAVIKLGQMGIEKYVEQVMNSNRQWIESVCKNHMLPHLEQGDAMLEPDNIIDLIGGDSIYDFGPFDIIFIQYGKNRHVLTRASFAYILKKGKNPYNNEPPTPHIINCIEQRLHITKKYGLPDCQTLCELLQDLKQNGYTVPTDIPTNRRNIILSHHAPANDFAAIFRHILGDLHNGNARHIFI